MRSLRKSSALAPYVVGGLSAAVAAGLGMALVRWALLVRTIPERVMEWLLLFVPVDVFEAGVIRFIDLNLVTYEEDKQAAYSRGAQDTGREIRWALLGSDAGETD